MKQTLILAALALVVATPAFAQEGGKRGQGGQPGQRRQGGGPQGAARRNPLARMIGELDLNADQKAKADKMMDEMSKKLMEINKEYRDKLEGILTDAQKKKMQELMQQARQRGPGGPGAGRPARP
jgi:Spy/CpxP family protein refolding chaperone